jgi:hypothetical protein
MEIRDAVFIYIRKRGKGQRKRGTVVRHLTFELNRRGRNQDDENHIRTFLGWAEVETADIKSPENWCPIEDTMATP